jgi:hypothetical protein
LSYHIKGRTQRRVFENRVLRAYCGLRYGEGDEEGENFVMRRFHNFYSSQIALEPSDEIIKSRNMMFWACSTHRRGGFGRKISKEDTKSKI